MDLKETSITCQAALLMDSLGWKNCRLLQFLQHLLQKWRIVPLQAVGQFTVCAVTCLVIFWV